MPVTEYLSSLIASETLGDQVVHHEILPEREAHFADMKRPLSRSVAGLLAARGVEQLYSHQAQAVDMVRAGRNVVIATPTASGKTMTYNLPVIEQILANPDSRALYLFPLKALAQDQFKTISELTAILPKDRRPTAGIYDGDTSAYKRKKYRDEPPNILLTNPEMLHLSILAHHASWSLLLSNLTHVVIDEVHTYRGVMGSHMAMVFRRLRRLCSYYGADPKFVFCSATVANPVELTDMLTGVKAQGILDSGAPQGKRHFVFMNPMGSPSSTAIKLLQAALHRGLRTIVYTQSRKMTELISMWAADKGGEYRDRISAYRSGFLPEERREIEARMSSGELLAVVSTSALELGIDIGALDVCILVGYPGTVMSTLQRGGRVGRKQQESAIIMVGGEDALDQYFMRHPEDFFTRPPEAAVLNPYNPVIMDRHLDCAAAELTLRRGEDFLHDERIMGGVNRMLQDGRLLESAQGGDIHSKRKRPHREVDLRGSGSGFTIEEKATGRIIGQIDMHRAFHETHEGAIYLHLGRTYVVSRMDVGSQSVEVEEKRVGYYTRVRTEKSTEILEVRSGRHVWGTRVFLGKLKVTELITGYEKRAVSGGKMLGIVPLDLPPLTFETEGIWIEFPRQVQDDLEADYFHFMGGIHAVEHAAIGILPLLVMTDRNDLGGISTPFHEQLGCAAVFVYDGHPGGVGLTRQAFEAADELLERTLDTVQGCECELGCPSCVHSPKCGSGNRPIDKAAAIHVLNKLKVCTPETAEIQVAPDPGSSTNASANASANSSENAAENTEDTFMASTELPASYGVLDVETRRSAQECGGWNRADRMGVSIAVLYDSRDDAFHAYEEHELGQLAARLDELALVIGFNIKQFDYKVLAGAHPRYDFKRLPTLDLLVKVKERLGYRLSLDSLAQTTLDAPKSADGLQALEWWKEGKLDLITKYCTDDVRLTRDLYLYGKEHGYVLFTNKAKKAVRLPIEW